MTSQAEKDWEEFQYGLQGISTGSMHNQLGKDSRVRPSVTSNYKRSIPRKPKLQKKMNKKKAVMKDKSENSSFSFLFAVISFFILVGWLYQPEKGNGEMAFFVSLLGSLAIGRWYKVILVAGITIFIAMMLGQK